MPVSAEGTRRVRRGRPTLMTKDSTVITAAKAASGPASHGTPSTKGLKTSGACPCAWPSRPGSLKLLSCDRPMTIARPLAKPISTEAGTRRTRFPTPTKPMIICTTPIKMTA